MALGSGFGEVIARIGVGEVDAFAELYRDLHPGLSRYARFLLDEDDPALVAGVWRELVARAPTFGGFEADFRAIAFGVLRRRVQPDPRAKERERHYIETVPARATVESVGQLSADAAIAALISVLTTPQAEVVVLQVLSGLDAEMVAHVLATTVGAIRLAQHRALIELCRRITPRARRGWANAGALPRIEDIRIDVSDQTPESVFRGALPAWQATGALANVSRLLNAARRAPLPDEVEVPHELSEVVRGLARPEPSLPLRVPTREARAGGKRRLVPWG